MAADPIAVRTYKHLTISEKRAAQRALDDVRKAMGQLGSYGVDEPSLALGEAQRLALHVAEVVRHLSALAALREVEFLVEEER